MSLCWSALISFLQRAQSPQNAASVGHRLQIPSGLTRILVSLIALEDFADFLLLLMHCGCGKDVKADQLLAAMRAGLPGTAPRKHRLTQRAIAVDAAVRHIRHFATIDSGCR